MYMDIPYFVACGPWYPWLCCFVYMGMASIIAVIFGVYQKEYLIVLCKLNKEVSKDFIISY